MYLDMRRAGIQVAQFEHEVGVERILRVVFGDVRDARLGDERSRRLVRANVLLRDERCLQWELLLRYMTSERANVWRVHYANSARKSIEICYMTSEHLASSLRKFGQKIRLGQRVLVTIEKCCETNVAPAVQEWVNYV